jgi:hypothetical protein
LIQNRDAADPRNVLPESIAPPTRPNLEDTSSDSSGIQLSSVEDESQYEDQPPNHEKPLTPATSSPREHSSSSQMLEPQRKRTMSNYEGVINLQSSESPSTNGCRACEGEYVISVMVVEGTPATAESP